MTATAAVDVRRSGHRLRPDPRRVLAKLFVPGQEGAIDGESRAGSVVDRVLELDDDEAAATLAEVVASFAGRHADLDATLDEHFELVAHRIEHPAELSTARRRLVGAYFTQEYAVESAAICNPSIVPHPDQSGLGRGRRALRDEPAGCRRRPPLFDRVPHRGRRRWIASSTSTCPERTSSTGRPGPCHYRRDLFHRVLRSLGDDGTSAAFVLDSLPDPFTGDELEQALGALHDQLVTRRGATETIDRIRWIATSNYEVTFPTGSSISERVLVADGADREPRDGGRPLRPVHRRRRHRHLLRDLHRLRRHPRRIAAPDHRRLPHVHEHPAHRTRRPEQGHGAVPPPHRWPLRGAVSMGPRDQRHRDLRRPNVWDDPVGLQRPAEPWELIQLGNCGSPIETPAGWIVLTHGVGPMRRYAIGAELLDLDDPTRVIGHLTEPLLTPAEDERDGYVPNVVYSCGAMLHGDTIVLPYGMSDANVGVATIPLRELLDRLT